MKSHQLADIFPMMSPAEFEELKRGMKESGQREPITLYEGVILDGRSRSRACLELGIDPITEEFNGGDPVAFVLDKNLRRRHLTESQRAMVAAELANLEWGSNRYRRLVKVDSSIELSTQADAANTLSISKASIKRARKVVKKGVPELVRAVKSGDLSVNEAAGIADLPERDQVEIALTKDKKERKKKARDSKAAAKQDKSESPPEFHLSGGSTQEPKYYGVAEWEALSGSEKDFIVDAGFESKSSKLNEQTNDSIEWARWSLNTVTGCLHNCPYCYARDIANKRYPQGFTPTFHPCRLGVPARSKIPDQALQDTSYRNIFANSMSDLFGKWVPAEWIEATIEMARRSPGWNFLTLTKFPQRAADFNFPDNWWMGTTVDAQSRVANAERCFEKIQCGTKWLSVEPLLEPLKFNCLDLFQWIVIGGSTSSTLTPTWIPPIDWIAGLHQQARAAGLRIYYKTNCGMEDGLRLREFAWGKQSDKKLPESFRYLKSLK